MSMKRGEIIQVTVEDLAPDGRGVAGQRPPIYIKGALPGEVVNARLTRVRGGWAEALPESFITRSKMRVRPRCLHFGVCGGCEWQNIAYEHQLDLKRRLVENHLRARMGSETPPIDRPLGSEQIFFYRNKMEYSFERDEEGNLILGLHHEGRYDRVFDLAQCYLQSEGSNAIVKDVREFARSHFLTPYSVISHEGLLRLLVIREGKNTGETMVNLVTS
ncbi:MAG TPA: class I SAM-dependent RNA methyltransferase, partial [Candidatus Latescibacteria bacterium]|nr:class I SAM-dependent RNA methyltransferase [Candidatus Latescibacterota bacterium]